MPPYEWNNLVQEAMDMAELALHAESVIIEFNGIEAAVQDALRPAPQAQVVNLEEE